MSTRVERVRAAFHLITSMSIGIITAYRTRWWSRLGALQAPATVVGVSTAVSGSQATCAPTSVACTRLVGAHASCAFEPMPNGRRRVSPLGASIVTTPCAVVEPLLKSKPQPQSQGYRRVCACLSLARSVLAGTTRGLESPWREITEPQPARAVLVESLKTGRDQRQPPPLSKSRPDHTTCAARSITTDTGETMLTQHTL